LPILAILYQLKVVPELIFNIIIGFVAFIVLFLGLSFGLGGKDFAAKILEDLEKKINNTLN
jgi:capsular polysaccharide biosynthesis protein